VCGCTKSASKIGHDEPVAVERRWKDDGDDGDDGDGGDGGDHLREDMHALHCIALCLLLAGWLAGWCRVLEEAGGVVDEFVVRV
jgi:hypothetical protein